jgi:hypothetical protein
MIKKVSVLVLVVQMVAAGSAVAITYCGGTANHVGSVGSEYYVVVIGQAVDLYANGTIAACADGYYTLSDRDKYALAIAAISNDLPVAWGVDPSSPSAFVSVIMLSQ